MDRKFSSFTNLSSLLSSDILVGLRESNPPTQQNIQTNLSTLLTFIQANIDVNTQVIYVDQSGSDVSGVGSAINPYATVAHAYAQITDASSSKPYLISVQGAITDPNLVIKPWIFVNFQSSIYSVTGTVTLDSSWSSGGTGGFMGGYLSIPSMTLDFHANSVPNGFFTVKDSIVMQNSVWNIIGNPDPQSTIYIQEIIIAPSTSFDLTVNDCYGGVNGGDVTSLSITINGGTRVFSVSSLTIVGNYTVTLNSSASLINNLDSLSIYGTPSYTCTGAGSLTVQVTNTVEGAAPQLTAGSGAILYNYDKLRFDPVTSGLVALVPIAFIKESQVENLNTDLTNLQNQINSIKNGSIPNIFYVDPVTGVDSPSNTGSITLPFASYEYAAATAAPLASIYNQYGIIPVGSFTPATNFIIYPYVNILGLGQANSYFTVSSPNQVVLDNSWGTISNPVCFISNITLLSTIDPNLVYSGPQDNSFIVWDNVSFGSIANINVVGSGTALTPEVFIVQNCIDIASTSPTYNITNATFASENSSISGGANFYNTSSQTTLALVQNATESIGAMYYKTTSTGELIGVITACLNFGNVITLDGTSGLLIIDSSSYTGNITLVNGATLLTNVAIPSLAEGVNAAYNFEPVNYTPVSGTNWTDNSQTGYNAGIDDAFGSLTFQKIYNTGPGSGIVNMTANGGIQFYNPTGEVRLISGFDETLIKGHKFLFTISTDINIMNNTDGVWCISDGIGNHNINFMVGAIIDSDAEFYFTNNKTGTLTINVPAGVTFNNVDGSVVGSYVLNQPGQTVVIKALNSVNDFTYNVWYQHPLPTTTSGTFTVVEDPSLTSNISSFSTLYSSFITIGNITQISGDLQFVPTLNICTFAFDLSSFRSINFVSNSQAGGVGTIRLTSAATGSDGSVVSAISRGGTKTVTMPMIAPAANGTNFFALNFNFQFVNQ